VARDVAVDGETVHRSVLLKDGAFDH
jgi:hypothetical protein